MKTARLGQMQHGLLAGALAFAVVLAADGQPAASAGATAMKVYVDPKTGEIVESPAEALPAEAPTLPENALSTSSEGLVETPSPTPGGGVMIDLQGRFRSPLTATRDAAGKLSIQHMPEAPDLRKQE